MLYNELKDFVKMYELYYKIMKQINLEIWDMMDILRDSNISNEDYLIKCKECFEANDIRFRIKNKINFLAKSLLKEQKGYKILRVIFNVNNNILQLNDLFKIIKYYSFLYDELIIIDQNDINIDFYNNEFIYDPTIFIKKKYEDSNYIKYVIFENKNINQLYDELNITKNIINNYFIHF